MKDLMLWVVTIVLLIALILFIKGEIEDDRQPIPRDVPGSSRIIKPERPKSKIVKETWRKDPEFIVHTPGLVTYKGELCMKSLGQWQCYYVKQ